MGVFAWKINNNIGGSMQVEYKKITSLMLMSVFAILVITDTAYANKSECSDVLRDGTKATSLYHEKSSYRRVLDYKLSTMTYHQAKTDRSLTGNIPIGDVILGAGFTEKTFDDYKHSLSLQQFESISSDQALDILISTGDREILSSWRSCMVRGGLGLRWTDIHAKSAVLEINWFPTPGINEVKVREMPKLPKGVTINTGKNILEGKQKIVAGAPALVEFAIENAATPVSVTLNVVSDRSISSGSERLKHHIKSQPYRFDVTGNGCETRTTVCRDTRHKTGTRTNIKYCSHSQDGWRFSKNSNEYSVSHKSEPLSDGNHFSRVDTKFVGNNQFEIVLGCSSSQDTTDIQCCATTTLNEIKDVWEPDTN
jgi:hypothetical protein